MALKRYALTLISFLLRVVHSLDFAYRQPRRSGLAENHYFGHTTDIHPESAPIFLNIYHYTHCEVTGGTNTQINLRQSNLPTSIVPGHSQLSMLVP